MDLLSDLEARIRSAYALACESEAICEDTGRPAGERADAADLARNQWICVEDNLAKYRRIGRELHRPIADDIRQVEVLLFQALLKDFRRDWRALRQILEASSVSLNSVIRLLARFESFQEELTEWKELHNLTQECLNAVMLLVERLEVELDRSDRWDKGLCRRLWRSTHDSMSRLEIFAKEIKYIDAPLQRTETGISGPSSLIRILVLRNEVDASFQEDDLRNVYESAIELQSACLDALYQADKRLRDTIKSFYTLSSAVLRSI